MFCLAAGALSIGLAGCGTTNWGFPYRATIQQGNWITSEQVAQLAVGMSRDQVRFVLGTPTLQDIFHANRWDYPYYNQPGYGEDVLRQFTVWFDQDQLVRWAGSEQPDRQPFQQTDNGAEDISNQGQSSANQAALDATSPGLNDSAAPNTGGLDTTTPEAIIQTQEDEHTTSDKGL
ncbi:outer membrane protein assembly factor BamE [Castellaniella sp.]|uniref:outer membrane protein assembly factor BamE n=1 Tax=Castellaniella sp. TaxID=1955812 RepID=UPI002AFDDEF4|nr:outer membrane protein assembly factor BamE [Castellaniella sp.]